MRFIWPYSDKSPSVSVSNTRADIVFIISPYLYGSSISYIQDIVKSIRAFIWRIIWPILERARERDHAALAGWRELSDQLLELDEATLERDTLLSRVAAAHAVPSNVKDVFGQEIVGRGSLRGSALLDAAFEIVDARLRDSFEENLYQAFTQQTAPVFKRPEVLAYIEGLEKHLERHPIVGKVNSLVDSLKKASYELNYVSPSSVPEAERKELDAKNESFFDIPDSVAAVGQIFTQLEGMKKKDALFHLVTKDYSEANLWVQLQSGDNKDMERVVAAVKEYVGAYPWLSLLWITLIISLNGSTLR